MGPGMSRFDTFMPAGFLSQGKKSKGSASTGEGGGGRDLNPKPGRFMHPLNGCLTPLNTIFMLYCMGVGLGGTCCIFVRWESLLPHPSVKWHIVLGRSVRDWHPWPSGQ